MTNDAKLNLFISYSHSDEEYVNEFIKHLNPQMNNGSINVWYDRNITPGNNFQKKIYEKFECSDIICLIISANFLSSQACLDERKRAIYLMKKKWISVVPIIISPCGWLDDIDLSLLLALPTDGKPINSYSDKNKAWNITYEGIKRVIYEQNIFRKLQLTSSFVSFLEEIDLLEKAHPNKERVLLDDIFIYPELEVFNDLSEYEDTHNSEMIIKNIPELKRVLIIGENQSGKTTLCKRMISQLLKLNYVPIYVSEKENYHGKIEKIILKSFNSQYENIQFSDINSNRIVIILDNFHIANNKEKHLSGLADYQNIIAVVDDIFSLNFKDDSLTKDFMRYKIKEFDSSLRYELLKKWILLTDKKDKVIKLDNDFYRKIDNKTNLVNTTLGKAIGGGIMPSYPFYILSIVCTYDAFSKPLDQEITSQGYCYQALIYMYLRKQKIKTDEMDIYINFLTELSYYFYNVQKSELSEDEFEIFMNDYKKSFNLPLDQEVLIANLVNSCLIAYDNFKNFSFRYEYLYYFFVARYLAENLKPKKNVVNRIINNLQKDENAYIAIFISHHTKDDYLLDEILLNAYCLFDDFNSATLSKSELKFFDDQVQYVTDASLPSSSITPEKLRKDKLRRGDYIDDSKHLIDEDQHAEVKLETEIRRSFKTVEVMGRIIKNRAGSLEIPKLEAIFEEAMKVNLRIINWLIEFIKQEEAQKNMIEIISTRINEIIVDKLLEQKLAGKKERIPNNEELEKISKTLFWNINFIAIYSLINKAINSLGSDKLNKIIMKVCDVVNTPASFIIKHGILMWYSKNLQVENITKEIEEGCFSRIAERIMRLMIVEYSSMHFINYKEKQKLESKLRIPHNRLNRKQNRIQYN